MEDLPRGQQEPSNPREVSRAGAKTPSASMKVYRPSGWRRTLVETFPARPRRPSQAYNVGTSRAGDVGANCNAEPGHVARPLLSCRGESAGDPACQQAVIRPRQRHRCVARYRSVETLQTRYDTLSSTTTSGRLPLSRPRTVPSRDGRVDLDPGGKVQPMTARCSRVITIPRRAQAHMESFRLQTARKWIVSSPNLQHRKESDKSKQCARSLVFKILDHFFRALAFTIPE